MTARLDLTDIQGNIVRGYGRLGFPKARYQVFRIHDGEKAREFVAGVSKRVTTSATWGAGNPPVEKPKATTNIAFTFHGLQALGLPTASLIGFPQELIMGMKARRDILGDDGPSAPEHWDPVWNKTVDIWISINGQSVDYIEERYQWLRSLVDASQGGVEQLSGHRGDNGAEDLPYQEASAVYEDGKPSPKEHFGYTDGIGDAVFKGQPGSPDRVLGRGKLNSNGGWEPLATGEFLLGHPDEAREYPHAPMPILLARNGSFMACRKLHENVGSFHRFLDEASAGFPGGKALLAAKFSGRWADNGAPVVSAPDDASKKAWDKRFNAASKAERDRMLSDFSYKDDLYGAKCPISGHIRRINPRGSLEFGKTGAYDTPGALDNRRRILRRGLAYGEVRDKSRDDGNHGIIFMAVSASIERQFEFLQQQWINYGNDFKEGNDKEVLLGNHHKDCPSKVVIQADPDSNDAPYFVNNIPRLVETRGGEYFFIPGMTALRMIAAGTVDPT